MILFEFSKSTSLLEFGIINPLKEEKLPVIFFDFNL